MFNNAAQTLFEKLTFKGGNLINFQTNFLLSYGEQKSSKYLESDLS